MENGKAVQIFSSRAGPGPVLSTIFLFIRIFIVLLLGEAWTFSTDLVKRIVEHYCSAASSSKKSDVLVNV